jgi:hypothetical protein
VNVGEPTWSSTTSSSSRSRPSVSIVSTKFRPPAPNSHDERTTRWLSFASAVARSPASFEWPYSWSGPGGSDSRYGSAFLPSKT